MTSFASLFFPPFAALLFPPAQDFDLTTKLPLELNLLRKKKVGNHIKVGKRMCMTQSYPKYLFNQNVTGFPSATKELKT